MITKLAVRWQPPHATASSDLLRNPELSLFGDSTQRLTFENKQEEEQRTIRYVLVY